MRKSMWLMAAFLFSMFISGCGGGTSPSVIGSTHTPLVASDVSGTTFFSTPVNSTTGYVAFQLQANGNATWDSLPNRDPNAPGGVNGTWQISNGQLVLSLAGQTVYQFTCIQKEPDYFLMADASNNITRFYRTRDAAENFLIAITPPNGNGVRLGGGIQGMPLLTTTRPAFANISTLVGVTGQSANPFANFTSSAGRTPPVTLGMPIAMTTLDGKTFFVLDNPGTTVTNGTNAVNTPNVTARIQVVTLDSFGGGVTSVKTLSSTLDPSVDLTFNNPSDITSVKTSDGEYLYVADPANCTIDKIALSAPGTTGNSGFYTGTLTVLAGSPGVSQYYDGAGNTPANGAIAATVGAARFASPIAITTDGTNLYVSDDDAIRKIDIGNSSPSVAPQVTTLAGNPGQAGMADAVGTTAHFNVPRHIATDGTNLYVADSNNYTIRKVAIATGQVTTIAGTPGTNGTITFSGTSVATGNLAHFSGPNGITTDGTSLYVTDFGPVQYGATVRGQVVFQIVLANPDTTSQYSGPVTRIAGTQDTIGFDAGTVAISPPYSGYGGKFNFPSAIITDGISLYVADSKNFTIRRIK